MDKTRLLVMYLIVCVWTILGIFNFKITVYRVKGYITNTFELAAMPKMHI